MQEKAKLSDGMLSVDERAAAILKAVRDTQSRSEQFWTWMVEQSSLRAGLWVSLFTVLAPTALVSLPPALWPRLNGGYFEQNDEILAFLLTVSEISSGMAGILLAIIVFSIQLHAQRDDEAAFMTKYLVRKRCVHWIIGYALGWAGFIDLCAENEPSGELAPYERV